MVFQIIGIITCIIFSICVILSAFYLINILKKLGKTLESLEIFLEEAKTEIKPAISGIRQSVEDVKDITESIDEKLKKTDTLFEIIEKLSKNIQIPANLAGELTEAGTVEIYSLLHGIKKGIKKFYELNRKRE